MRQRLLQLFAYDHWANREILSTLQRMPEAPQHSLLVLAHILAAQHHWLNRIENRENSSPIWPTIELEDFDQEVQSAYDRSRRYLQTHTDDELGRHIQYKNSKGERFINRIDDALLHIVFHSGYHRGQIAAGIRQAGFDPTNTDYITALRQDLLEVPQ